MATYNIYRSMGDAEIPKPHAKPVRKPQASAEVIDLRPATEQPDSLSAPEALRVVRMIAADTDDIVVIPYGRKRARQRKVTRRQIELCVQKGTITEGPFVNGHGNWQNELLPARRRARADLRRGNRVGDESSRHKHVLRKEAPMYQYKESGLDNIFLENGYHIHKTPYGEGVSIQDTEGLHKVIGRWLISLPKPLTGAELRFLRLEMEATQRDLAAVIGTSEQSLRLWEKHRNKALPNATGVPGSADRLLRAIYSEYIGGDGTVRRMLDRLAQLNQVGEVRMQFRETNRGWKRRSAPSMGSCVS
jgi:putative transcriptional regulator